MSIPIIIGVTGHRNLCREDIPTLRNTVRDELRKLQTTYPNSEFVMLNSLAAGADQLCAQVALELGIALVCPLPMEAEEYRKDFNQQEQGQFEALLQAAREVFVAPHTEAPPATFSKDFCYRQAGMYIAAYSHVMLALWDGTPEVPGGCGAAEAVAFMLRGTGLFKAGNDGAVLHIHTNRADEPYIAPVSVRLLENQTGCLTENLSMIDTYNRDEALHTIEEGSYDLLPKAHMSPPLSRIENNYHQADHLSMLFQKRFLRTICLFSVFSVLLVLSFLLYDEAGSRLTLMGYTGVMAAYIGFFLVSAKKNDHEKYLQYRVLAESLRVQLYLSASGQTLNVAEGFTWTQKQESAWVKEALSALLISGPEKHTVPNEVIKEYWIDGQLAYHKGALNRNLPEQQSNKRLAKGVFISSLVVLLLIIVLEFKFSSVPSVVLVGEDFSVKSLMLVLLGLSSAGTAFLSSYYGKLSLERKCMDSEKMILLYTAAQARFGEEGVDISALLRELAQQEIIENGNWYSYCKDNKPSFDV